jgi:diguanylate cyclase (GGDEF)-like protein
VTAPDTAVKPALDAGPVSSRAGGSETIRVLALVAGLLTLAVAVGLPVLDRPPFLPGVALPWWALAPIFTATEIFVLHIQRRREAQIVSFSEMPLVLGLFFAAPAALLLAQFLASAAVMVLHRRTPPLKTAFNLALGLTETCIAVALFSALAAGSDSPGPVTWLAAYVAALAAHAVGVLAIGCVVVLYEGSRHLPALLRDAVLQPVSPIAVTLALLAVISLWSDPISGWLLVAFTALLLAGFRTYASLADQHISLERLFRFSQVVSSAPEIDAIMAAVLAEAKALLRSERASVAFVAADGELLARMRLGVDDRMQRSEEPPSAADRWVFGHVLDGGTPLLMPRGIRDPGARGWLDHYGMRDAVAVPLSSGTGIIGVLTVADRLGDVRTFEPDDVLMLETVANHASVALRHGELIDQLRHEALHDALTGLPNRTHLQRALGAVLDDVAAGTSPGAAVMILDLDEFKEVNDTLGHQYGDLLLVEVGARLTATVGTAGTVARLGGDEFAVLLPGSTAEDAVLHLGRRILRALEQPIPLDNLEVEMGASLGIALAPAHATDPAALLKRADLAMYDAKSSPRNLRLYEPELDTNDPRRLTVVSELRAALHNGDIEVHVQPQARLSDGAVVGVEALVRWQHPEFGWVPPDEFIPIAERSGLIGPLTSRVLDAALRACARWRAAGSDLSVAVNLSARSLHDADLVEEVARLLRRYGVPANRLTLEVTEGSVMADPTRAIAVLHQLRDLGVRLSVDDFGTGYSSLSYLKRLPVHEVKVDRSFIATLGEGGDDVAIVRAIIDLGRHLGLQVVAEGVEDAASWELLASMRCDLVQGWHLARPMPTAELLPWLVAREQPAGRGGLRVV